MGHMQLNLSLASSLAGVTGGVGFGFSIELGGAQE